MPTLMSVLTDARALTADERRQLAETLWAEDDPLHGFASQEEHDQVMAEAEEVARRIDAGEEQTFTHEEVMQELRERRAARSSA